MLNSFENCGLLITSNFDEPVLYNPIRMGQKYICTSLKIITAFIDIERISTHIIKLSEGIKNHKFKKGINIEIILGMVKSSLSPKKHEDICRIIRILNDKNDGIVNLSCKYICKNQEVHSKIYIWQYNNNPFLSYCGSLNYTMNAFYKRRESICISNPQYCMDYYNSLLNDTVDCYDYSSNDIVKYSNDINKNDENPPDSSYEYEKYNKMNPIDTLQVSLLRADGSDTGYGSGVNWGIRQNGTKRNANQAYIPYNLKDRKDGFFPDRIHKEDDNCPMFRVITKDFGTFHMRMAQQNNKALHSVESNAILGEWIRTRIGIQQGQYITKEMLESYGKTVVTFRKYEDGTYLLDF